MNLIDLGVPDTKISPVAPLQSPAAKHPLHRLGEVRRSQGITRRTVARHLGVDLGTVKVQEEPFADIPLSVLYAWQRALEVPLTELLAEPDESLSAPVQTRARMVRLMKTTKAIFERSVQPSIRRMAQMLCEQLVEMMPELKEVSPWHAVGRRRTPDELGRAAERRLTSDLFHGQGDPG